MGGADQVGEEGDDAQHVVVVHRVVQHVVHVVGGLMKWKATQINIKANMYLNYMKLTLAERRCGTISSLVERLTSSRSDCIRTLDDGDCVRSYSLKSRKMGVRLREYRAQQ